MADRRASFSDWFFGTNINSSSTGNKDAIIQHVSLDDGTGVIIGSVANPLNVTGGGGAATIADGADVAEGATTATAYSDTTGAAAGTVVGIVKGLFKLIAARLPLGGKAPAASLSVIPAGLNYKLAAASATTTFAQGGAGATGDYLSHVNIQPTSTTLAAFTILDNAVVVHNSAAQTLLDLRQITVPIGAFSVSGAWKVTMGAGGTATGFGTF